MEGDEQWEERAGDGGDLTALMALVHESERILTEEMLSRENSKISTAGDVSGESGTSTDWSIANCDPEVHEAKNICLAAFLEIMTMALEANTSVETTPAFGSTEELLPMFRGPVPPGMRVEYSIESAVVPVTPPILVSMMLDVVMAEFHLPTPLVGNRKCHFVRWAREIAQDIWAVIDTSSDYFPQRTPSIINPSEPKCRRRPSGVIVRPREYYSEVIWIENNEVYECQDNIYSASINSNLAFGARRWVNTLIWKLKRDISRFSDLKMIGQGQVKNCLLKSAESMKMVFLECVNAATDERKWVIVHDEGTRVLKNIAADHGDSLVSNNYVALTSMRVPANPLSVYDLIVKKNLELQQLHSQYLEEPEEVMKLQEDDQLNCITLHKRVVDHNESTQISEYLLQEASRDEFCSFIIEAPMTQLEYIDAFVSGRWWNTAWRPWGFAIMADGSIHAEASLVTIAVQGQLDVKDDGEATELMSDLINNITRKINEEVAIRGIN
ncbi:hypothetical protein F0562_021089 [Nyssa sinensis]|uniref:START domain-containing protein n=1 Tax=Nyssa sinensis TaxID=561372 RepID=A0A5J5BL94_9ASTE|nr:hypothetical protein F0562_021089 [Nyssa sinensis]